MLLNPISSGIGAYRIYSKKEVQQFFQDTDKNHDGNLTQEELKDTESSLKDSLSDLNPMDKEFKRRYKELQDRLRMAEKLDQNFDKYDGADNNGINSEEINKFQEDNHPILKLDQGIQNFKKGLNHATGSVKKLFQPKNPTPPSKTLQKPK